MSNPTLRSPLAFLESVLGPYAPFDPGIFDYATQWQAAAGPDLQQRDRGYAAGIIRRVHTQESLLPSAALLYITAFYAPKIAAEYIDSLLVRHIVDKYAPDFVQPDLLAPLHATVGYWQGVVRDDVAGVLAAQYSGTGWTVNGMLPPNDLSGDALLVHVGGMFFIPRQRKDGSRNLHFAADGSVILNDSQAWLMAAPEDAAALRMELETLRLVLSALAFLGNQQRTTTDESGQRTALALAWAAMQVGDDTAREVAGLYSDTYMRFRLLARLAYRYCGSPEVSFTQPALDDNSEAARSLLKALNEYLPVSAYTAPLVETLALAYRHKLDSAIARLR